MSRCTSCCLHTSGSHDLSFNNTKRSGPQLSGDVSEQLSRIETAIRRLQHERSLVLERRNQALDIYRLPSEIVVEIFLYCIEEFMPHSSHRQRLMSVCRMWGRIVNNTCSLWTNISETQPKLFQLMLKRSGTLPLRVNILREPTAHALSECMHRVSHLSLTIDQSLPLDIALSLLKRDCPLLRVLKIYDEGDHPHSHVKLPKCKLQYLTITGACFDLHGVKSYGQTLVDLKLYRTCLPASELIYTLSKLPKLRRLVLHDAAKVPRQAIELEEGRMRVHLSELEKLDISSQSLGAECTVAAILRELYLPPSTDIKLSIAESRDGGRMEGIIDALSSWLQRRDTLHPMDTFHLFLTKESTTFGLSALSILPDHPEDLDISLKIVLTSRKKSYHRLRDQIYCFFDALSSSGFASSTIYTVWLGDVSLNYSLTIDRLIAISGYCIKWERLCIVGASHGSPIEELELIREGPLPPGLTAITLKPLPLNWPKHRLASETRNDCYVRLDFERRGVPDGQRSVITCWLQEVFAASDDDTEDDDDTDDDDDDDDTEDDD
jgi:hypothetical protein